MARSLKSHQGLKEKVMRSQSGAFSNSSPYRVHPGSAMLPSSEAAPAFRSLVVAAACVYRGSPRDLGWMLKSKYLAGWICSSTFAFGLFGVSLYALVYFIISVHWFRQSRVWVSSVQSSPWIQGVDSFSLPQKDAICRKPGVLDIEWLEGC